MDIIWIIVEALPDNYREFITECGETPERVVCDYIAGMSDQYSVAKFEEIFSSDIVESIRGRMNQVGENRCTQVK